MSLITKFILVILFVIIFVLAYKLLPMDTKTDIQNTQTANNDTPIPTNTPTPIPTPEKRVDTAKLKSELEEYAKANSLELYLSYDDLKDGKVSINGDKEHNALSTIKVEVMIEIFKQLEEGKIKLEDSVERYGYSGTVESALDAMMITSSNEATGALILEAGGVDNINATLKTYLGEDMQTLISHTPGFLEGGYNISIMDEQTELIRLLYEGKIVSESASKQMIELMERCFDYFALKEVEGVKTIAQKTGYNPHAQFGITALIQTEGGSDYALSFQIKHKNGGSVSNEMVREIVEIVNQNQVTN